jgi:hypothetical protein
MSFAPSKFLGSIRITENVLRETQGEQASSTRRRKEKMNQMTVETRSPQGKEFVASKGRSSV